MNTKTTIVTIYFFTSVFFLFFTLLFCVLLAKVILLKDDIRELKSRVEQVTMENRAMAYDLERLLADGGSCRICQ